MSDFEQMYEAALTAASSAEKKLTTIRLSPAQIHRLELVERDSNNRDPSWHYHGRPVSQSRMGRYITLLKHGLVRRGVMPGRDMGGKLVSPQTVYITDAGRRFLTDYRKGK
jgi:hypothetical protein